MVRITSWNVNGIRNPFGYQPWRESRSFAAMFDILEADIVIMQELKIQRKDLRDDMVLVPGWDCYFSLPKHKKGYSGVGIYTRQSVCAPIRAEEGIMGVLCPPGCSTSYRDLPEEASIGGYLTPSQLDILESLKDKETSKVDPTTLDSEGRCVVIEFPAFVLFGVYGPANSSGTKDDFRKCFIYALETRIRNLDTIGKRVILTGDLNITREAIDSAKVEEALAKEGLSMADYLNAPNRRIFNQLLENGKVIGSRDVGRERPVLYDLIREFHPQREGMFTHWEQKINARPGNYGSRIDYVLCSISMKSWFTNANIQEGLMGSDHCPVYAETKDLVDVDGDQVHLVDMLNPPGMFKGGQRRRDFSATKDYPAFSGRRLPEFDTSKRRNIKDMFTRKASFSAPSSMPNGLSAESFDASETEREVSALVSPQRTMPSPPAATESSPAALSRPEKRRSDASSPTKPVKRNKSNVNSQALGKGQRSLKGFFTSKTTVSAAQSISESQETGVIAPGVALSQTSDVATDNDASQHVDSSFLPKAGDTSPPSPPFIDPEASKESWTKLFSKKPPPRCESHREPCITLTTKKPGANCGRQFWICPRPIGPSGQKENGTQWRCGTFIWASDWKS